MFVVFFDVGDGLFLGVNGVSGGCEMAGYFGQQVVRNLKERRTINNMVIFALDLEAKEVAYFFHQHC